MYTGREGQNSADHGCAWPGGAGQGRAGMGTGQGWARMNRDGQGKVGQCRTGPDWRTGRTGMGREGSDSNNGQGWSGKRLAEPDETREGRAGPRKAKQGPDRTGQSQKEPERARNGQSVPGRAGKDLTGPGMVSRTGQMRDGHWTMLGSAGPGRVGQQSSSWPE